MGSQQEDITISSKITDWLGSIVKGKSGKPSQKFSLSQDQVRQLLQKAAVCYASARWNEDACRIFEHLGDYRHAAPYHEQLGRWTLAAMCYRHIADWKNAARCFLEDNQPDNAAECLMKAGDPIQAAWLWADKTHRFYRAESVIQTLSPESDEQRLEIELILARCEAGKNLESDAAGRLKKFLTKLRELPDGIFRRRLNDRLFIVAETLKRPDIIALIHASAVSSDMPNAVEKWEAWAMNTFGEAVGVPIAGHESQERIPK